MLTGQTRTNAVVRLCLKPAVVIIAAAISTTANAGNFFNGESLYKTYCQSCHGNRGQGMIGGAPNFARGQGLMKPDAMLYDTIDHGRNAMPSFRGVLKEEEFFDVITYIRSFL